MAKKPATRKKTDDFESLASQPKYTKAWKEARKVEAGDSFATPDLPDGTYTCRVTSSKVGVTKNKELYWMLNAVIVKGEHKGTKIPLYFSLEPTPMGDKGFTRLHLAAIAAKRLDYEFEDDSASPADFKGIAEELDEEKPCIQISARNEESEVVDKKTKKKVKKEFCRLRVERSLGEVQEEDDEEELTEEEEETSEEEEVEEDEDTSEDEEEESEDEPEEDEVEEEEETIEKGNAVLYKSNGAKRKEEYVVLAVRKDKADLRHSKTRKVLKGVPVDELEIVYEE